MDYQELNNLLVNAHTGSTASECHGYICGYLCCSGFLKRDDFLGFLNTDINDRDSIELCYSKISSLADEVNNELASDEFTLALLLPGDDSPLVERSKAFVQWCEGFLSGLAGGGLTEFDLLTVESREVIQDMYKFCRLDIDDIRSAGEDEESAFMELTEYVRVGVILLYEEMHQKNTGNVTKVIH